MKRTTKITWPLAVLLAGSVCGNAAIYPIVDETYDPPTVATPSGWEWGVVQNVTREYVKEGVGRTGGLQVSATLPGPGDGTVAAQLYQSGYMAGNELATRDNTVLTFDLKVDAPGLAYVGIHLDAFRGFLWSDAPSTYTGSLIPVALGGYTPGVFKKIVVLLNDPNASQLDIDPAPDKVVLAPLFDPSARTYNNIALVVDSACLTAPGSFKLTVDNVKVTTKSELIPLTGTTSGTYEFTDALRFSETGIAAHIGSFKARYEVPFATLPVGSAEIIAANGDKLMGTFVAGEIESVVQIEQGTGRFQGARGSLRAFLTGFDMATMTYQTTLQGALSTVGSNGK